MKTHFRKNDRVKYGDFVGVVVAVHHDIRRVEGKFSNSEGKVFSGLFLADGTLEVIGEILPDNEKLLKLRGVNSGAFS